MSSCLPDLANHNNLGGTPGSPSSYIVSPAEILEKIPDEGMLITDLIKMFQGRLGDKPGQMPKAEWIKLVKQLCDYGLDKRLRRRK